jgi:hypothetical protein
MVRTEHRLEVLCCTRRTAGRLADYWAGQLCRIAELLGSDADLVKLAITRALAGSLDPSSQRLRRDAYEAAQRLGGGLSRVEGLVLALHPWTNEEGGACSSGNQTFEEMQIAIRVQGRPQDPACQQPLLSHL